MSPLPDLILASMSKLGSKDVYSVSKASTERFSTSTSSWVPLSEAVSGSDRDRQRRLLRGGYKRRFVGQTHSLALSCFVKVPLTCSLSYELLRHCYTELQSQETQRYASRESRGKREAVKDYVNDVISR